MSTPSEARTLGFITPTGSDLLQDGDNAITQNATAAVDLHRTALARTAAVRDEATAATKAVADATTAATAALATKIAGKAAAPVVLADGTDIDTLRDPGRYVIPTIPSARTMLNYPTTRAGTIDVTTAPGSSLTVQTFTAYISTTAEPETYSRATLSATSWPQWYAAGWSKGLLKDGTDLQKLRNPGVHHIVSAVSARTMADLPTEADGAVVAGPAHIEVMPAAGSGRAMQRITIDMGNRLREFKRSTGLTGSFPAWQETAAQAAQPGGSTSDLVAEVNATGAHRHAVLRNHFTTRRGGRIGTGGVGVYAIRIDHWLEDFKRDMLPALRANSLPFTVAMNARNWGSMGGNNGNVTPDELQSWSLYDGASVANHSATHAGTNDPAGIVDEIVNGQRELQAQLPRLIVDEWHMPGVASDIAYSGFGNGNTATSWLDTLAGRAIMHSHGHASGYMHGFWHELTGAPQIGEMPQGADSRSLDLRISDVETVAQLGKGLVHLIHGNAIKSGQLSLSDWEAFCSHVAAMRDAGKVLVLTTAGESVADARSSYRAEILQNPELQENFLNWSGATGWTSAKGEATTPTRAATLTQVALIHSRHGWVQGSQIELVTTARAAAEQQGELTLSVEDLSDVENFRAARTFTIPADGAARPYRLNMTIPRPHDLTQLRIQVGRTAAGGPLAISDLHMRPI